MAVKQVVGNEIHRPALIDTGNFWTSHLMDSSYSAPWTLMAQVQAFFTIDHAILLYRADLKIIGIAQLFVCADVKSPALCACKMS